MSRLPSRPALGFADPETRRGSGLLRRHAAGERSRSGGSRTRSGSGRPADHAGLDFAKHLIEHLQQAGHEVVDHGPREFDPQDDYPAFCINAALAVVHDQREGVETLGVVFGGSGNGEQIAANKVRGVRAALIWNEPTALLARQHNDANVCAVGARQHELDEAIRLIDLFLAEPFSGEERHARRIAQLAEYEGTGRIGDRIVDPGGSPATARRVGA